MPLSEQSVEAIANRRYLVEVGISHKFVEMLAKKCLAETVSNDDVVDAAGLLVTYAKNVITLSSDIEILLQDRAELLGILEKQAEMLDVYDSLERVNRENGAKP